MAKVKALIPNLITAGNLLGGVLAIIFALTGRLEWAPYCIFISAILDFLDGFAARLLKVQSELGKQLDSLADMVTFGVAPGVMVFMMIKIALLRLTMEGQMIWAATFQDIQYLALYANANTLPANIINEFTAPAFQLNYLPYIALLIPVMSMFRLAKFNLDARQSDSFIGLPTPANTLFFAVFPLLIMNRPSSPYLTFELIVLNPWFLVISTIVMSILLVAELPLFALKFKSFSWKGNGIRYIFLTLAVVMLATLHWLAIPILIILYILLSVIQNLLKKNEKVQS
jgi:CDP-diacylglycerol---serine O-phosphatidyltransferase